MGESDRLQVRDMRRQLKRHEYAFKRQTLPLDVFVAIALARLERLLLTHQPLVHRWPFADDLLDHD